MFKRSKFNNTDIHIGTRIRQRRRSYEISQTRLAHAIGVSLFQLRLYEMGHTPLKASHLHLIAHELGVPTGYFFLGAPTPKKPQTRNQNRFKRP